MERTCKGAALFAIGKTMDAKSFLNEAFQFGTPSSLDLAKEALEEALASVKEAEELWTDFADLKFA